MEKDRSDSLRPDDASAGLGLAPALEMEPAEYLPDMDEFDLTENQKVELLQTLWNICRRFVEMDIDIGDANPCGQIFSGVDEFPPDATGSVKSSFSKATEMQTQDEEDNPA